MTSCCRALPRLIQVIAMRRKASLCAGVSATLARRWHSFACSIYSEILRMKYNGALGDEFRASGRHLMERIFARGVKRALKTRPFIQAGRFSEVPWDSPNPPRSVPRARAFSWGSCGAKIPPSSTSSASAPDRELAQPSVGIRRHWLGNQIMAAFSATHRPYVGFLT